jgi:hypothetical protein
MSPCLGYGGRDQVKIDLESTVGNLSSFMTIHNPRIRMICLHPCGHWHHFLQLLPRFVAWAHEAGCYNMIILLEHHWAFEGE